MFFKTIHFKCYVLKNRSWSSYPPNSKAFLVKTMRNGLKSQHLFDCETVKIAMGRVSWIFSPAGVFGEVK